MIASFLSTQSRKAWVAGVLGALLQPLINVLSGADVLTVRTLVVAVLSGVIAAAAVWATDNAESGTSAPKAVPAASATGADATAAQTVAPAEDFSGQTVTGE